VAQTVPLTQPSQAGGCRCRTAALRASRRTGLIRTTAPQHLLYFFRCRRGRDRSVRRASEESSACARLGARASCRSPSSSYCRCFRASPIRGSKVLVSLDALHLGANSFMVGVLARAVCGLSACCRGVPGRSRPHRRWPTDPARFVRPSHRGPRPSGGCREACLPCFCPGPDRVGPDFLSCLGSTTRSGSIRRSGDRAKNFSTFFRSGVRSREPLAAGRSPDSHSTPMGFRARPSSCRRDIVRVRPARARPFPRLCRRAAATRTKTEAARARPAQEKLRLRRRLIMSGVALTWDRAVLLRFIGIRPVHRLSATRIGLVLQQQLSRRVRGAAAEMQRAWSRRFTERASSPGRFFIATADLRAVSFFFSGISDAGADRVPARPGPWARRSR